MAILVVEFGVTKVGRFMPKSEQIQRKIGYSMEWNKAEKTKIGTYFYKINFFISILFSQSK